MIEMRWLEYESVVNIKTSEHFSVASKVKKLQYRYRTHFPNTNMLTVDAPWSDWQDVPTVTSEELKC